MISLLMNASLLVVTHTRMSRGCFWWIQTVALALATGEASMPIRRLSKEI
jgi:hypothetical protein